MRPLGSNEPGSPGPGRKSKQGREYIPALLLGHMTPFPLVSGNVVTLLSADFGRISRDHDAAVDDLRLELFELGDDIGAQEVA